MCRQSSFNRCFVLTSLDSNKQSNPTASIDDIRELSNYEAALDKIGFGKFQWLLLFVCGLANASDAVEILCVSFVLPTAECDLNMTSADKGVLNAITFLGMD
jgi:VNT family MFS transporter (synaptic vesicle glycoprotein 2)